MKTQKGRSLVEMLAVLALMALIGFSAYQGVDFVLRKNTTSNIWKEVLIRASAVRSQNKQNNHLNTNIAGFENDVHGVHWQIVTPDTHPCHGPSTAAVGIEVSDLDSKICGQLIEQAKKEHPKSLSCLYEVDGIAGLDLLSEDVSPQKCSTLVFGFSKKTSR